MVQIDILTLFPQMFTGPLDFSILRRAQDRSLVKILVHNLRDWATDKYKSVDDHPYGGGAGMILRVDIVDAAVAQLKTPNTKVILLDAAGKKFTQQLASEFSRADHLILICGHYEGVDHRVHEHLADEVISIGDYVLSGGEIPALVLVDSIVRLLPGALGNPASLTQESFSLEPSPEYPQYTRPEVYKSWKVPDILLSGHHAKISKWRKSKA